MVRGGHCTTPPVSKNSFLPVQVLQSERLDKASVRHCSSYAPLESLGIAADNRSEAPREQEVGLVIWSSKSWNQKTFPKPLVLSLVEEPALSTCLAYAKATFYLSVEVHLVRTNSRSFCLYLV